jgi:RimJ/RimL family protein N-acetyltransferase
LLARAFAGNGASRRVLEMLGFAVCDEHVSDGIRLACYTTPAPARAA